MWLKKKIFHKNTKNLFNLLYISKYCDIINNGQAMTAKNMLKNKIFYILEDNTNGKRKGCN